MSARRETCNTKSDTNLHISPEYSDRGDTYGDDLANTTMGYQPVDKRTFLIANGLICPKDTRNTDVAALFEGLDPEYHSQQPSDDGTIGRQT